MLVSVQLDLQHFRLQSQQVNNIVIGHAIQLQYMIPKQTLVHVKLGMKTYKFKVKNMVVQLYVI